MLLYGTIPCFYTVLYHAFIRYYTMLLYGTIPVLKYGTIPVLKYGTMPVLKYGTMPVLKYGTMCENHGNDHMNIRLNFFNEYLLLSVILTHGTVLYGTDY